MTEPQPMPRNLPEPPGAAALAARGGAWTPRRDAKRRVVRHQIVKAAREVFAEKGYIEACLGEISRRADVAKPTVYRYFAGKTDLFLDTLCSGHDSFAQLVGDHLPEALDPADQIRWIGRMYLQHWREHPYSFQIFWALENLNQQISAPRQKAVKQSWSAAMKHLVGAIDRGVCEGHFTPCSARETAWMLWRLATAMIGEHLREGHPERLDADFEARYRAAIDLMVRGLERAPASEDSFAA